MSFIFNILTFIFHKQTLLTFIFGSFSPGFDNYVSFKMTSSIVSSSLVTELTSVQKQSSRGVLRKGALKICSKFTGRTPRPKCDFNKIAKQLEI